ncbi:hypothetical protein HDU67_000978, partial [Dinochytrium kinnereticum]
MGPLTFTLSLFRSSTTTHQSSSPSLRAKSEKKHDREDPYSTDTRRRRSRSSFEIKSRVDVYCRQPRLSSSSSSDDSTCDTLVGSLKSLRVDAKDSRCALDLGTCADNVEGRSRARRSVDETIMSDSSSTLGGSVDTLRSSRSSKTLTSTLRSANSSSASLSTLVCTKRTTAPVPALPKRRRVCGIQDVSASDMLLILSYLDSRTILTCERVCRDWRRSLITVSADAM